MIIGVPIVFCMLGGAILYLVVNDYSIMMLFEVTIEQLSESFVLLSVPFFIMAAGVMNFGGITNNIFNFARQCVGWITGGLAHANIFASVIFAGMSGSAVADAGGLGQIELKAMKDAGYDEDFSLAITGASALVSPIIPPSIPAVLYGVAAGVSIGQLLIAGLIPGILMALSMAVLAYIQSKIRHYPKDPFPTVKTFGAAFKSSVFELMTPIILIGGIMMGVFTPTEASSVAVMYAVVLVWVKGAMGVRDIPGLLRQTADSVCNVLPLVGASGMFAWVLSSEQLPVHFTTFMLSFVTTKWMALIVCIVIFLIAGCFLDTAVSLMILPSLMVPLMVDFGVDPVHFGIITNVSLMIGLSTPPFGMVAFVLSSISGIPFERIVKALMPYMIAVFVVLFFITFIPEISLFLPRLIFR
jgi:tripartite ATP-independent transporter DctM subunit